MFGICSFCIDKRMPLRGREGHFLLIVIFASADKNEHGQENGRGPETRSKRIEAGMEQRETHLKENHIGNGKRKKKKDRRRGGKVARGREECQTTSYTSGWKNSPFGGKKQKRGSCFWQCQTRHSSTQMRAAILPDGCKRMGHSNMRITQCKATRLQSSFISTFCLIRLFYPSKIAGVALSLLPTLSKTTFINKMRKNMSVF